MSVRKTSFSAFRCAATAAAAVSALTLSQPPSASRASDGMTGTTRPAQKSSISAAVHARHLADAAEVDRLDRRRRAAADVRRTGLERAGVQADGPAAEAANLGDDAGVDLVQQHADDDVQGGVVGVAAALDLARLQAGRRPWPDRSVCRRRGPAPAACPTVSMKTTSCSVASRAGGVFHGAAAELDDRQPIAERADVAEGFDQGFGFADGVVHRCFVSPLGRGWPENRKIHSKRSARGVNGVVRTNGRMLDGFLSDSPLLLPASPGIVIPIGREMIAGGVAGRSLFSVPHTWGDFETCEPY